MRTLTIEEVHQPDFKFLTSTAVASALVALRPTRIAELVAVVVQLCDFKSGSRTYARVRVLINFEQPAVSHSTRRPELCIFGPKS